MFKYFYYFILIIFCSCANFRTTRILSEAEKSRYNLNGILNEAKICPHLYDDMSHELKVSGACEVISCKQIDNNILCIAKPE